MPASSLSLEKLEKICLKNPTSILFARLAEGFLQQGNVKRAAEICRQGLRYRPSYVAGHVVMGKCHLAFGHFEEARQEFQKVLQLDADHPAALWHLGQIDLQLGWEDLALRHFELALVLDPLNKQLADQIAKLTPEISVNEKTEDLTDNEDPFFEETTSIDEPALDIARDDVAVLPEEDAISTDLNAPRPELIVDENLSSLVSELAQSAPESRDEPPFEAVKKQQGACGTEAIATVTLAELYAQQGLVEQALATLEQVLLRDPNNVQVQARIDALRS
jgi:tetratricopeptide (TPR) repeat protein